MPASKGRDHGSLPAGDPEEAPMAFSERLGFEMIREAELRWLSGVPRARTRASQA